MVSKSLDGGSSSQVNAPLHFFKIILCSDVSDQKLRIPKKFISQYGNKLGNQVFLKVPSSVEWKVELEKSDDDVWMCNGWKEFAKHYSIAFGHLLVFRYDGNYNFHVLIFDMSASEIEYPVSATHGEQTNINGDGNSKITDAEAIEIDDSMETLGDIPSAKYNTRKEEIHRRVDIGTCLKTRKASYYRANIDRDIFVEMLDDSLVTDFSVSDQERAKKKSGGTSIEHKRHRSQMPVEMTSATANVNSTALERAQKFKSRKPFFVVQMHPTYVSGKFGLNVPGNFLRKYLRENHKNISLQFSDGMTWSVRCYTHTMNGRHTLAWRQFARDNSLKVGDVCVFELMSKGSEPKLNVTIFPKSKNLGDLRLVVYNKKNLWFATSWNFRVKLHDVPSLECPDKHVF